MILASGLLSDSLTFGLTQRYLGGSELLSYWLDPSTPSQLANQVERVLLRLDALLDVDFQRTTNRVNALLEILPTTPRGVVDPITGKRSVVIGEAIPADNRWRVEWANSPSGNLETIVHELGHVLGLGHPNRDNPSDSRFNTADTVMSYNRNVNFPGRFFTSTDLSTLVDLWGLEDDPAQQRHNWVAAGSALPASSSFAAQVQQLFNESTNSAFIYSAYWPTLGRGADPGGFSYWLQELGNGLDRRSMVDSMLLSQEAAQLLA